MIERKGLEQIGKMLGFTIWQDEKDYLQHLFLLFLSRHAKNELVFKGGTALQKTYALGRFSIDLDFTLNGNIETAALLHKIAANFSDAGYGAEEKHQKKGTGIASALNIRGPLYDGREKTLSTLRVDISAREKVILKPVWREVVPMYEDLRPYTVLVMDAREILAEKMRAVMTRTKARDVYDLWFLLQKGVGCDTGLVSQKLAYYQMDWKLTEFRKRLQMKESIWEAELRPLLADVPPFAGVRKAVLEKVGV